MKKFIFLLVVCVPAFAFAQTWDDTVRMIEKLMERYKPGNPGAQLAISRNGQVIYSKAWGMADLEHNVPLTTTSIIEAGSVSKQFTAAAILLLEEQGKLSLNDDVRKHIPELKNYGTPITLRHMMQHTSGLKDWGSIAALAGWPRSTKTYNNDDALHIISLQQSLNNTPGSEYIYSNSGYNLFAIVVERVSGMSLADFTKKFIFEPAGMTRTEWRNEYRKVVPNRAIAYSKPGGVYYTNMPNEFVYGNGGLLTTAEDLLTWTHYYMNGKLGGPALLKKQLTTNPLNNGNKNDYAAGLFIGKINGVDLIAHDGATAGYRANLEHLPSVGVTIAWLSNTAEFSGSAMQDGLRNLFVKPTPAQTTDAAVFNVAPATLESYQGWYRNSRSGSGVRMFVKDGKLNATQIGVLQPVADRTFRAGGSRVELFPDHRRNGFVFINSSNDSIYFTAVDSAKVDTKTLNEYAGEYYSPEVEATYLVFIKNKLYIRQKIKSEFELTPTYKDGFDTPLGPAYFERDRKNKVVSFKVSISRARNVEFKKVQ